MTNREWLLERIKTLSDDELAELFCQTELDYTPVDGVGYYNPFDINIKCWRIYNNFRVHFIEWLNAEHIEK